MERKDCKGRIWKDGQIAFLQEGFLRQLLKCPEKLTVLSFTNHNNNSGFVLNVIYETTDGTSYLKPVDPSWLTTETEIVLYGKK